MEQLYLGNFKINEGIIIDNLKQINYSKIQLNKGLGLDYKLDVTLAIQPAVRQALLIDNEIFLIEKVKNNYDGTYDVEALPLHYILRDIMFKELTPEKYTFVSFYGSLNKLLEMIVININWHFYSSTRSSYDISSMLIQTNDIFEIDDSVDDTIIINKTFSNMTLMEVLETLTNELQLKFIPQKTILNIQSGKTMIPKFLFKIIDINNYIPNTIINLDEVNIDNIEEDNLITANKLYVNGGQDGLQSIDYVYPSSNIMTPNYGAITIGDTTNGEIEGKIQTNVNPRALYGYVVGQDTTNHLITIEGNILGSIPILNDDTHDIVNIDIDLINDGTKESHDVFGEVRHFSDVSNIIELSGFSVPSNETDRLSIIYFAFKSSKFVGNLSVGVVNSSNDTDAIEYYNIPANVWVYIAVPYKVDFSKVKIGGIPNGADVYIADLNHVYSAVVYDEDLSAYSGWFNVNDNTFQYQIIQVTTQTNVWQMVEVNYHTCEFISDTDLAIKLGVANANKFISKIGIAEDTSFTYNNNEQYVVIIWNNPVTYLMIKQAEGILTTFVEKLKPFIGQSIKTISLSLPAIDKYKDIDIGVGLQFYDDIFIVRGLSYNPIAKTEINILEATTSFTDLNEIIKHAETLKGINYFTINDIEEKNSSIPVISKPSTSITPTPEPSEIIVLPPEKPFNLALDTVSEDGISFIIASWDVSIKNETLSFEVAWSYDGFRWNYITTSETSVKFEVVGNKTVYVKVRTLNLEGKKSNWTIVKSIISAKDEIPPDTPTGLTATGLFQKVMLKWNANTEVDFKEYEIQIASDSNFTNIIDTIKIDATSFVYTGAVNNTYYFRIRAIDTSGNVSNWSTGVSATTAKVYDEDLESQILNQAVQDIADAQDEIDTLNNTTIPNLQTQIDNNTDAINTLNNTTIPNLQSEIDSKLDDLPGVITETHISEGAITTPKIAAGAVTANEIAAGTITSNEIASRTIKAVNIESGAITANEIAAGTITANEIAAEAITTEKIATGAITSDKLTVSEAVITDSIQIANSVIKEAHIEDAAISTAKIKDGAITNAKIGNAEIDDAKIASIDAGKITTGYLSADRIQAKSITMDKLSVVPSFSLPEGTIAYFTNSLIDDVNGITPEGYDEVNLAPSVILTPENAPEGSVVGDLLAGNKIYAGHEIQVGNSVFIKNVNNGGNEEGKIIVKDGTTEIVKIGEKVATKFVDKIEILVDITGGGLEPDAHVYASLDNSNWIDLGLTSDLEGNRIQINLFNYVAYGQTIYLKVEVTSEGTEDGDIDVYVDDTLFDTYHYDVDTDYNPSQVFTITLPEQNEDGIEINSGVLNVPNIIMNTDGGKIIFKDSYWELKDYNQTFDYYKYFSAVFENTYKNEKIELYSIENEAEAIDGFGIKFIPPSGNYIPKIFATTEWLSIMLEEEQLEQATYITFSPVTITVQAPQGMVIPQSSVVPSSPSSGAIYFNRSDKHFYGYNGSAWVRLD